ncbi:hypothetical protein [Caulobacter sp.]|uniref:hypothetical protein n=1 Tax=Caulobacter sp. TaxID=78 RepID=UPI001B0374C2|nr:hypothetical protein [Caulobacter sp.]MBO9543906.1 hypothetical protein [Caulobacter sp.]
MHTTFRQGDLLIRTGMDLPHLGVFAGQVYEVDTHEAQHPEGLFLKGWIEGFDPLNFRRHEAAGV